MRGFGKLAATAPGRTTTIAAAITKPYSTFSPGGGAAGGGRGRGRGSIPPPPSPSASTTRIPGQPQPTPGSDDAFAPPGLGHGRGQPIIPPWSSAALSPAGRGRATPVITETPDPNSKKPIFFSRDDVDAPIPAAAPLPARFVSPISGLGRGKAPMPSSPSDPTPKPREENRHLRPRPVPAPRPDGFAPEQQQRPPPRGPAGQTMRGGRGGRGMTRGRGRGRGGRFGGRGSTDDASDDSGLYLGENADGERFEKRLGEENAKKLAEGFEEMSYRALPSMLDDAYLDALHTNNLIEYEPEYAVEFDRNPDIDEKPPMSLEEVLQKAKPFLMAYEGIKSQEEWEEAVEELMERLPHMKELMDMYSGPDRVTAKQQQQELERVAKTLPENIPSSVKRFTDRAVLSLQSNPGWGWDKKCQFMDKLVGEVSKQYNR